MNILKIENLTYAIENNFISDNINISFKENTFTGVIGPNGSGKSTLLKQIYRVLKPTKGKIYLKNFDIEEISSKEIAKQMAVLPQENQSDFDYTVREIILMGRFPYHSIFCGDHDLEKDVELMKKYLNIVGLTEQENQPFKTLSGGEKQRVLLARALVQEGNLLILDEVTNHLDIGYQYKVLEILKNLNMTIISAIHDLNLAMKFCDYVVLIDKGRVIMEGKPKDIITTENLKNIFKIDAQIIEKENSYVIDYRYSYY
ncbi:ABC transporter, ATP-binding protein [Fusobacterium necrophorum subsp. funduliforme ATCC 51357]|uniref:ABC transporter ATP-binding protein n=1 Tax=Fusobacterium necrophorum subsp. funduliforme TaxID=143387 RepID=A0A162JCE1_9FUSO|nr:ABC transporter ATP-binding protein [Fusobacterium necrophorum]EIJ67636.1 ABC transporter, ATP-binding protein [Fusobacterium necrophorum subsp. funduliforme ATCC 51357]KYL05524.1 ABC transporter ATP-binding protein [Fusobacterium necrophorum subsp. funduliforme]KYM45438.1 ABC transporter ATP-binding protein [Fusobacterium necrophorum subsp. funduliforme]KYM60728.1 ABC transporter ATP-binding protein [Fusobacterium necrophorum subsp. funduliforme]KYM66281.1 ABC transporter ATP-binding prote